MVSRHSSVPVLDREPMTSSMLQDSSVPAFCDVPPAAIWMAAWMSARTPGSTVKFCTMTVLPPTAKLLPSMWAALTSLCKALELQPGHGDALRGCAALLKQLGRAGEAVPLYERAIITRPTARTHLDFGMVQTRVTLPPAEIL